MTRLQRLLESAARAGQSARPMLWLMSWVVAVCGLTAMLIGSLYMAATVRREAVWIFWLGMAVGLVCLGPVMFDWFWARSVRSARNTPVPPPSGCFPRPRPGDEKGQAPT